MSREIVLDTETTGLDPLTGDRVVEIGALELVNHLPTDRIFHRYINPERDMPAGAEAVHGLSAEFLRDKPVYAAISAEFEDFVGDATLVIHNAPFDMKFLNAERQRLGLAPWPMSKALDTLAMARRKFPGAQAGLDALCRRFGVDNSMREKHGALLDAELLAEVYLELIGGRQPGLALTAARRRQAAAASPGAAPAARPAPLPALLTPTERAAHAAFIAELGEAALWRRWEDGAGEEAAPEA